MRQERDLRDDDWFGCQTTLVPTLANAEFSIAAWIRLPRQQQGTLYFYMAAITDSGKAGDFMVFRVKKDGNLAGLHVIGNTDILLETKNQFAAVSYATAHIFAAGISKADATDAISVRDALAEIRDLDTVLGTFAFDANGNGIYAPKVLIVENQTLKPLTGAQD